MIETFTLYVVVFFRFKYRNIDECCFELMLKKSTIYKYNIGYIYTYFSSTHAVHLFPTIFFLRFSLHSCV